MFVSGDELKARGAEVIGTGEPNLIGNSYVLHLGQEAAASSNEVHSGVLRSLSDKEAFTIEAGQLAYLITEETIKIPSCCMGFISLDTRTKFRGLDDVSGFHVSPGYEGKLIFAVSNESSSDITVRRGDPIFRLWLSEVSGPSSSPVAPRLDKIDGEMLSQLSDGRPTVMSLQSRIVELERNFSIAKWLAGAVAVALITLFINSLVTNNSQNQGQSLAESYKSLDRGDAEQEGRPPEDTASATAEDPADEPLDE